MEHTPEVLEEARRHVRRKRIFFIVLGVWIALCVMWFVIDMTDDSSSLWFYWPMFGSGIGKSTSISAAEEVSQDRSDGSSF